MLAAVRTVFLRAVSGFARKKARAVYPSKTLLTAGLCVVQRFGSALQLAPHFHAVLFDGAYRKDADGKLHFVAAPAITPAERLALTTRIASRMERLLARRGLFLNGQWTAQDDASLQLSMEAMKSPCSARRRSTSKQRQQRAWLQPACTDPRLGQRRGCAPALVSIHPSPGHRSRPFALRKRSRDLHHEAGFQRWFAGAAFYATSLHSPHCHARTCATSARVKRR